MNVTQREHQRVVVGPEHTIRFRVADQVHTHIRVTNLSRGGCFALIPNGAGPFSQEGLLEDFAFEHPDLPQAPFTARIVYTLGGESEEGPLEVMGMGIQFLTPSQPVVDALQAMLTRLLGPIAP